MALTCPLPPCPVSFCVPMSPVFPASPCSTSVVLVSLCPLCPRVPVFCVSSVSPCLRCPQDVKCSGNWMWGAKTGAEGGALVTACEGLVGLLHRLGVAIDGGKDSLSMAARVGTETVLAPGESRCRGGGGGCCCRGAGSWVPRPPPWQRNPGGVTAGRMGHGVTTMMMGRGCQCARTHGCHHHYDGSWVPQHQDPWVPPPR